MVMVLSLTQVQGLRKLIPMIWSIWDLVKTTLETSEDETTLETSEDETTLETSEDENYTRNE